MGSLIARKKAIMMIGRKSILPSEYQQVEYIEGTGTQYIQLPYGFDNTDTIIIDASINEINTDRFLVAPTTWNDNNNRFAIVGIYGSVYCIGYGNTSTGNTRLLPYTTNDYDVHRWTYNNYMFDMPELNLTKDARSYTFGGTTQNLKLFYGYARISAGKVAYYKHSKLNGNVYEFIPCYRKADGVVGLYDRINNVFYTNDGTGTFGKGSDV